MSQSTQDFRQALEDNHTWPCQYMFKFIVPLAQKQLVLDLFESQEAITTRESRNGRYVSITVKCRVHSSEEVIAVYEAASHIEGIISL